MAAINVKRPADLLGRHVQGTYQLGADVYAFDGTVEAVVLPVPGSTRHHVEFFVTDQYVSLPDCLSLDYAPPIPS